MPYPFGANAGKTSRNRVSSNLRIFEFSAEFLSFKHAFLFQFFVVIGGQIEVLDHFVDNLRGFPLAWLVDGSCQQATVALYLRVVKLLCQIPAGADVLELRFG